MGIDHYSRPRCKEEESTVDLLWLTSKGTTVTMIIESSARIMPRACGEGIRSAD